MEVLIQNHSSDKIEHQYYSLKITINITSFLVLTLIQLWQRIDFDIGFTMLKLPNIVVCLNSVSHKILFNICGKIVACCYGCWWKLTVQLCLSESIIAMVFVTYARMNTTNTRHTSSYHLACANVGLGFCGCTPHQCWSQFSHPKRTTDRYSCNSAVEMFSSKVELCWYYAPIWWTATAITIVIIGVFQESTSLGSMVNNYPSETVILLGRNLLVIPISQYLALLNKPSDK